ncbi:hypothetical protein JW756_05055 [Candidatus Woesearchaeota archaeon]|nr:hypothetical protein [Candidatus Woesearchaeota archaeon]
MNLKDLVVHTGIGAAATILFNETVGKYINSMSNISDENKKTYNAMGEGAIFTGVIGHGIGKQINTGNPNYKLKDQLLCSGIFAVTGAAAAYAIANYANPKKTDDSAGDASDSADANPGDPVQDQVDSSPADANP